MYSLTPVIINMNGRFTEYLTIRLILRIISDYFFCNEIVIQLPDVLACGQGDIFIGLQDHIFPNHTDKTLSMASLAHSIQCVLYLFACAVDVFNLLTLRDCLDHSCDNRLLQCIRRYFGRKQSQFFICLVYGRDKRR